MEVRNIISENLRVVPFQRYQQMFSPIGVQRKRKITAFSDLAHGLLYKIVLLIAYVLISRTYHILNGFHGVVMVKLIKTVQKNNILYLWIQDNRLIHAFYYIIKLATCYVIKRWARKCARFCTRLRVLFSFGDWAGAWKLPKQNNFRNHNDFLFLEKKSHISLTKRKQLPSPQARISIFFS